MIFIKLSIQSKEKEIAEFLKILKNILNSKEFDINNDFTIIRSKKKSEKMKFPYM